MESSESLALFWIVLIIIICIFGIIGNCLGGIVLLQKDLRSTTNIILLGLTLCDLLLLILGLIRTLGKINVVSWTYGGAFDTFVFFWDWTSTAGSKYFTIAISLERYIAVCHPFEARKWLTKGMAKIATVSVFGFCVFLATFSYIYNNYIQTGYGIYAAVSLHFFPFIVVLILNIYVYFGVRQFQATRVILTTVEAAEINITRMLLTVVLVFGLCYSFEFVRQILVFSGYFDPTVAYDAYIINHLSSVFYVLNSSVNFVIYLLMVRKFRDSFCKLFCRLCTEKKNSLSQTGTGTALESVSNEKNGPSRSK